MVIKITAVILTFNESLHINRVLNNIFDIVDEIVIVDSNSSDETIKIIEEFGNNKSINKIKVLKNKWVNYAKQFDYGVSNSSNDWILRIDADEYLDNNLKSEIINFIGSYSSFSNIDAFYFPRHIKFLGKLVKRGGVFPSKVIRLYNKNKGSIENRWMDEHIKVKGRVGSFNGRLIDDNRNSVSWWVDKHNSYASREAVEFLSNKYNLTIIESVASLSYTRKDSFRRFLKEKIYYVLPSACRPTIYYLYRVLIRLGYFDSWQARSFHWHQGYWYRSLVELKINECEREIVLGSDPSVVIKKCLGINIES